jgi:hypothetical protein
VNGCEKHEGNDYQMRWTYKCVNRMIPVPDVTNSFPEYLTFYVCQRFNDMQRKRGCFSLKWALEPTVRWRMVPLNIAGFMYAVSPYSPHLHEITWIIERVSTKYLSAFAAAFAAQPWRSSFAELSRVEVLLDMNPKTHSLHAGFWCCSVCTMYIHTYPYVCHV